MPFFCIFSNEGANFILRSAPNYERPLSPLMKQSMLQCYKFAIAAYGVFFDESPYFFAQNCYFKQISPFITLPMSIRFCTLFDEFPHKNVSFCVREDKDVFFLKSFVCTLYSLCVCVCVCVYASCCVCVHILFWIVRALHSITHLQKKTHTHTHLPRTPPEGP